jgi:hypothetical protein
MFLFPDCPFFLSFFYGYGFQTSITALDTTANLQADNGREEAIEGYADTYASFPSSSSMV